MNRSVRFPDELEARIRAEAVRQERSFNWVVVKALERALGGVAASGFDSGSVPVAGSVPARPASPRAPRAIPGVVRASGLAKSGVRPVPKKG